MNAQLKSINNKEAQRASRHSQAKLLAEQARIVARLVKITSILSSENPPIHTKTTKEAGDSTDFDRKAYAIGLIWRNPAMSTRELAHKVGVARSTLFLPSWSDVAAVLRARKNLSRSDYKGHHIDEQEDTL
jgi:hypothetical protein